MPLKDERERLGEGGIGHAGEKRVVDCIQGEGLFVVVPHLMHRDVEALVIHPFLLDARAQVRLVAAPCGAHRVSRAARRVHDDVVGEHLRFLRREAESGEQVGNVLLVGLGGRILLADDLV